MVPCLGCANKEVTLQTLRTIKANMTVRQRFSTAPTCGEDLGALGHFRWAHRSICWSNESKNWGKPRLVEHSPIGQSASSFASLLVQGEGGGFSGLRRTDDSSKPNPSEEIEKKTFKNNKGAIFEKLFCKPSMADVRHTEHHWCNLYQSVIIT